MKPLQFAIYKGTGGKHGALQMTIQRPHYYAGKQKDFTGEHALDNGKLRNGWKIREGCIFLEITSTKDKNVYDWDNKIILALSVSDMGKLLAGLNKLGETKIMHDPGAKTASAGETKKFLTVKLSDQGALFYCKQSMNGEEKAHTVPLSPDEVITLRVLLNHAIVASLNW